MTHGANLSRRPVLKRKEHPLLKEVTIFDTEHNAVLGITQQSLITVS